jgi:AraC-like DNA-binding protein
MNKSSNYLMVNNPNGRSHSVSSTIVNAEWVDALLDNHNDLDGTVASVQVNDLYLPNFWARKSEGVFSQDTVFNNIDSVGLDLLGSCFFPKAEMRTELKQKPIVESHSGTQNFKFDPQNEYRHHLLANTPFHIIHIAVSPDYFLNFLPEREAWADTLRSCVQKNHRMIGERSTSITLAQERILQNIIDCPLAGKFGVLMIETSIVQLLLLQMHSIFQSGVSRQAIITKKEIDIVHGVKEHLSKTFLEDHSLESLAKHFGTNTNKLMALFKKTFGKSLFEYISELKMDMAHRMLQEEGKMVVEVARVMGYKNPNHFSTAFKKRFGVSPSHVV